MFTDQLQEALCWFSNWAWEKSASIPGQKVLVVDEAWAYQTAQSIPDELQRIVQSGRKRNLRLMVLTQEPNRFNSSILNGVPEFVCFKPQSRPGLDLVQKYYGFDPEEVSNLQPLEFGARNCDSGGELRGKLTL